MIDREKLYTSKLYMEKLANGINPLDDSAIPEDELLNNVALCRSFMFVADVLNQVIANHCSVTRTPHRYRKPFSITEEQRNNIWISDKPIKVSSLASHINECLDEDVKSIAGMHISAWLEEEGLLCTRENGTQKNRVATSEGEALGIHTEDSVTRDGRNYKKTLYSAGAQAFIVANLEAIAEFAHK